MAPRGTIETVDRIPIHRLYELGELRPRLADRSFGTVFLLRPKRTG